MITLLKLFLKLDTGWHIINYQGGYKMENIYKRKPLTQPKQTSFSNRIERAKQIQTAIAQRKEYQKQIDDYQNALKEYEQYQAQIEEEEKRLQLEQTKIENTSTLEKIGTTLADSIFSLGKAATKGIEGVVDVVAGIAGEKEFVQRDLTNELLNYEKIDNRLSSSYLRKSFINENITGKAVIEGVGQQVPAILLSLIPGVGTTLSTTYFGLSAAGGGIEEAYSEGANYGQALAYGSLNAGIELATEKLFSLLGTSEKMFGKGLLDNSVKKISSTTVGKYMLGMLSEGAEEMISEAVSPIAKYLTYQMWQGKEDIDWASLDEIVTAGVLGALSAGVLEGGSLIYQHQKYGSVDIVNKLNEIQEVQTEFNKYLNEQQNIGYDLVDPKIVKDFVERQTVLNNELELKLSKLSEKKLNKVIENTGITEFDVATRKFTDGRTEFDNKPGIQMFKNGQVILDLNAELSEQQFEQMKEGAKVFRALNNAVNGKLRLIYTDKIAENGRYQNGTVVINVNQAESSIKTIIGHEVLHSLEGTSEYDALKNYILDKSNINKNKEFIDIFGKYRDEYNKKYKTYKGNELVKELTKDMTGQEFKEYIRDEMTADFVGKHLVTNESFINELLNEKPNLFKKIRNFLAKMTNKVSKDKEVSKDVKDFLNKSTELFNKALSKKAEAFFGHQVDSEGNPFVVYDNGEPRFNIITWEDGGRKQLEEWLQIGGYDMEEDINPLLKQMDEYVAFTKEMMKRYKAVADSQNMTLLVNDEGKVIFSAIVPNGDYPFNIDLVSECKKRETFSKIVDFLINAGENIENLDFSPENLVKLNQYLKEKGFETACPLCFVEAKRYGILGWARKVTKKWNNLALKNEQELLTFLHANKYNRGKPMVRAAYAMLENPSLKKRMNPHELLKSDLLTVLADEKYQEIVSFLRTANAQGTPKLIKKYQPYNGEVLKATNNMILKADKTGGVRLFSFSDFKVEDFFDYIQLFADLNARKLKLQAYTKEIAFAEMFGLTGAKINLSLVPTFIESLGAENAGLDANGNLIYDRDHSVDIEKAFSLRLKDGYKNNVGTILVGISDKQIFKALDSNEIDYIIPYHNSGLNAVASIMYGIKEYYTNYTLYQNTRYNSGPQKNKRIDKKLEFDFYKDLEVTQDPKITADNYLAWCKENDYIPKFEKFAKHQNYYKLLFDYKMYDGTTFIPQQNVTLNLPSNYGDILDHYLGQRQAQLDKLDSNFENIVKDIRDILKPKPTTISNQPKLSISFDYGTKKVVGDSIYDTSKTGMSYYDQFLPNSKDSEYMKKNKNLVGKIRYLTPREYFEYCSKYIFTNTSVDKLIEGRKVDNGKNYINQLKEVITDKKTQYPITYIDLANKGQEGLHRMLATAELYGWNEKRFPVLVVDYYDKALQKRLNNVKELREKYDDVADNLVSDLGELTKTLKSELGQEIEVYKSTSNDSNNFSYNLEFYYTDKNNVDHNFKIEIGEKTDINLQSLENNYIDAYKKIINEVSKKLRFDKNSISGLNDVLDYVGDKSKTRPRLSLPTEKESRFRQTALNNNPDWNQEFKDMIKTESFAYSVVRNKDLIDQVNLDLKNKRISTQIESLLLSIVRGKRLTDYDIAKGCVLIEKAAYQGLNQEANDLLMGLSGVLTEYGKAVQAASLISKLTPQGKLKAYQLKQSKIKVSNEKVRNIAADKRVMESLKRNHYEKDFNLMRKRSIDEFIRKNNIDSNLSSDITKIIEGLTDINEQTVADALKDYNIPSDAIKDFVSSFNKELDNLDNAYSDSSSVLIPTHLLEGLLNAKTQEETNRIGKEIDKVLDEQVKVSFYDKVQQWRYLSMLANVKTHLRNIVSNTVMGKVVVKIKNKIQSSLEAKLTPNERTTTTKKASDRINIYSQKLAKATYDVINSRVTKFNSMNPNITVFENKLLEKVRKINNDLLENVEDRQAFEKVFTYRFGKWATVNNYTDVFLDQNPDIREKGIAIATQEALEATFKDASMVATWINQIKAKNKIADLAISSVMPFTKTPINIAKRGLEYSPLGLFKSIAIDKKRVMRGEISATTWVNNMAKGLTGSMITALGVLLARLGVVSGASSDDEKERRYTESLGQKPFSIIIGDKTYTLDWLAPASIPFFTGVSMVDAVEKSKNGQDVDIAEYLKAIASVLDPMTEMTFLSSLNDALASYQDNKLMGVGINAVKSYVSSFIPTILGQSTKAFTAKRKSQSTDAQSSYFVKSLMAKIPFLNETLSPYVDVWGREDNTQSLFVRVLENMVYPFWAYENKANTAVDKEIMRLYQTYGNNEILPSIPKYYYTKDGERIEMDSETYTQYKKDYGSYSFKAINALISTSYYQNLTDEEKEDAIKKIYNQASSYAKKDNIYLITNALGNHNGYSAYWLISLNNITSSENIKKKNSVFNFINNLKLSKEKKLLLYAYMGYKTTDYDTVLIPYINSLDDLSIDERNLLINYLNNKTK